VKEMRSLGLNVELVTTKGKTSLPGSEENIAAE
jgi:hypothetical protein